MEFVICLLEFMKHIPVMSEEVIDSLQLKPNMNVIDCTLGDGGHAEAILEKTAPKGLLLGIDADPESILRAKNYLYGFGNRVICVRDNFAGLADIVQKNNFAPAHGILLDLGWSSSQFEERKRGFSFLKPDEPLDMRYNQRFDLRTAGSIVNTASEDELAKIFHEYGEEPLAKEIAAATVERRGGQKGINAVKDLVDIILEVYRRKLKSKKDIPWVGGLHPATKVFQALRIAVNDELGALERVLPQIADVLTPGGRAAIISFHSLEDRMVKHFFKEMDGKTVRVITKKAIVPSDEEAAQNSRAVSAKLRVIEKI